MKRQFAKNLTSNWAMYGVMALISFFLMPYILSRIGQTALGVWILVGSFSGYLGLFDFGIGFAVVRFVARYQRAGDFQSRNEVVATAFYAASGLALLVIAATLYIMVNAAALFDIPPNLVGQSQAVIFLTGLSIAIGFPLSIFSEALAGGLFRFDLFNTVGLLMGVLRAGLTILCLEFGWGLTGLGFAALVSSLLAYLWRARMLFSLLPDLSIHPRLVSRDVIRKIGGYSFFSFILVFSGRIAFYSDSFVVGYFCGIKEVAVFGIAAKLTEYLRQLIFTTTKLFSPVASRYDPDKDQASLRRIFYDGSRLHLLFSLPLSWVLFFWGGKLIRLWVGDAFSYSEVILQILLLGHVTSFLQGIGGDILLGVGRHQRFAILSLLAAIINISLSIILVKPWGLAGVAWGTTIPLTVLSLFYLPAATLRLVGGKPLEFIRKAVQPAVLASIVPGAVVLIAGKWINSLYSLFLWGAVVAGLFAIGAFMFGLQKPEKERIISELSRLRGRF